ncbi:hypothetical protein C4B68_29020 [Streptomyces dengpaensis]|uniref:DUF6294 domain-containing protein n=1 Tax=Streptomyces dengpaensis TaxID=2049881 RepID=A0ABN5I7J1_9ACTN|nr:hypothetical protein C4B68_29020 [Streptomyces dengpaensis]PIB08613.1 hypothetical protein B1C81_13620 [Streptomyces sp. HG99]
MGGLAALLLAAGTVGVALAAPAQARQAEEAVTQASPAADRYERVFKFRGSAAGDCRRLAGATWKLSSDGRAYFKGKFWSSSGDDAWLMRAKLLDSDGGLIGYIRTTNGPGPGDRTKFVFNLPESNQLYSYGRNGRFSSHLWDEIDTISLTRHC